MLEPTVKVYLATVTDSQWPHRAKPGRILAQIENSSETWERGINSSTRRFNRFRAPNYQEMLEEAGFEVIHFEVEPATPENHAARGRFFVAQKR
jgi:hypothetical protein